MIKTEDDDKKLPPGFTRDGLLVEAEKKPIEYLEEALRLLEERGVTDRQTTIDSLQIVIRAINEKLKNSLNLRVTDQVIKIKLAPMSSWYRDLAGQEMETFAESDDSYYILTQADDRYVVLTVYKPHTC